MLGFASQKGRNSFKEEIAIIHYSIMNKIPYKFYKNKEDVPINYIPVGSVEWCEQFLNKDIIIPDYYPQFLNQYLFRKIWKTNKWPTEKVFIKPADHFKKFTGFVIKEDSKKNRGNFWCSEVVNFENEWRYYISNSKVVAAEWYKGNNEQLEAPKLNIVFPDNYCAAIDFGILDNGNLALVEAHLPYACGWYGKNYNIYAEWIINGWNYIKLIGGCI